MTDLLEFDQEEDINQHLELRCQLTVGHHESTKNCQKLQKIAFEMGKF